MQGLTGNIGERGSLLEWRWTPFFALLTLALVVSLLTALAVPSAPLELFKQQANSSSALMKRGSSLTAQTGFGNESSNALGSASDDEESRPTASPRRGSLAKLGERNQAAAERRATRTESRIAEPMVRNAPPPPEPELAQPPQQEEEEEGPAEEEEEAEEEEPEAAEAAPPPTGAEQAEGDAPAEDINPERPAMLNPNVLRTLPAVRR